MDYVMNLPRTALLIAAFVLLLIVIWPGIRDLWFGIYATFSRSGFVSVTGDLLIYAVLFGIIAWAALQFSANLADGYMDGRPVRFIGPVQVATSDAANADGAKLAQLLSINLSAIALNAERSLPSGPEFSLFRKKPGIQTAS